MKPYRDITDPTVAKALAHPLRTRILGSLEGRTASPSELALELDAPLGVVSYHVRRLTALGFLKLVRRVPRRGAVEHYYTTTSRPRITNQAWASVPTLVKQATIGTMLNQVGSSVSSAAAVGGFDAPEAHLTRSRVRVDEQGWHDLARELDGLTERIAQIEADSAKRLADADSAKRLADADSAKRLADADSSAPRDASVVLMLFESAAAAAVEKPAARTAKRRTRSTARR